MALGERIRERREAMNLSREDLSNLTGISHAQLARYELEDSQPTAPSLIALSKILNVSVDWLLGIDEPCSDEPLSPQELQIIRLFREKSPERRLAAIEIMRWA